jgi:hypothetical protein
MLQQSAARCESYSGEGATPLINKPLWVLWPKRFGRFRARLGLVRQAAHGLGLLQHVDRYLGDAQLLMFA